jgi:pyruvate dehydrogenase E2 component (dihydrolipoamide acetyltransferase)
VSGQVHSLGGKVGDVVTVGTVIVVIDTDTEAARDEAAAASEPPDVFVPAAVAPVQAEALDTPRPIPAAPATRRLARELGVDLRQITPSGPAGRVTPEDVHRHAAGPDLVAEPAPAAAPESRAQAELAAHAATAIPFLDLEPLPDFSQWGPVEIEALRSIRRKVAHKMTTSMILAPHVAHMDEADVTDLEAFRRRERERRAGQPGGHLTLLAFVVKAVTAGLRATPAFNASLDPFAEQIVYKRYYNIGIAADTGKGLVVPVIKETDRRSIIQVSAEIERLVGLAREGALDVEDLRGGTFTITNVGPLGGTALIPAINYPEVAILGMGKVQEKPVVRDGQIVIRKILPLTLAFDHRIADGADAARFVSEMVRQLSDPNLLLLET